jgi:hypothetical protein
MHSDSDPDQLLDYMLSQLSIFQKTYEDMLTRLTVRSEMVYRSALFAKKHMIIKLQEDCIYKNTWEKCDGNNAGEVANAKRD